MANPSRLRVLIADDYEPIVTALTRLVALDYDIVGRLADGVALLAETRRLRPDVLLLDLNLPNVSSLAACGEITRTMPATKVIVLTAGVNPDARRHVLAAGASAFIDKSALPHELLRAIEDTRAR